MMAVTVVLLQACTAPGLSTKKARDASLYNAQLGAKYLQRGELDHARDKLSKALKQDPSNAVAHVTYALLQQRIDKPAAARKHFRKAIELDPEEAEHHNSYGIFLCKVGEYEAAEAQFDVAANNPYYKTPEYALDNAGLCMLEADNISAAETYLREALRVNTRFANAYLHMAELMHREQRMTVADAYFQRFLAYGRETSESLWLGLQIKRDSGDMQAAERYASRLLDEFPESSEAGEYLSRPAQ
jgi:type IV pilus assembly protein PilF